MQADSAEVPTAASVAMEEDALLLDINRRGVHMETTRARVRLRVKLRSCEHVLVIVPIWRDGSTPYHVRAGVLFRDAVGVADVLNVEFDDAVLSYARNAGQCLTLNTNARSRCTGCVFCHYSLEDSEDPRMPSTTPYLQAYVFGLLLRHNLENLRRISRVGLSTGCFENERAAIAHVTALYSELARAGFRGGFHLLSSVVRSKNGLAELAAAIPGFHLILTVECFENRSTILKPSKSSMDLAEATRVLQRCRDVGLGCDYTYIAGLDRLSVARLGLRELNAYVTEFPKIQVFQPHAAFMRKLDVSGSSPEYYDEFKQVVESDFICTAMRPAHWQNYRSPWTLWFGDSPLSSPVI